MSSAIETSTTFDERNMDVEQAVRERYSAASQAAEASLCCPVNYDSRYLEVLPDEIVERDYGCGNPSEHVCEGDDVLDLGSGGGKICFIASQVVGPEGSVIGVDMNDDMLGLARKYQDQVGDRIGWHNVDFRKGRIQDLALSIGRFEQLLQENPVQSADRWLDLQQTVERLRQEEPLVANDSVDVVISNCVLNLVRREDRHQMFSEIYRVLRRGGRAVISDIVCDEPVPDHLQNDPALWSGCISGAFLEHEFLKAFEQAGFYGVEIVSRQEEPWATLEGIELRSMTLRAYKGKDGPCMDHNQAVIYQGPWKSVTDDDGHVLRRGVRTAVCKKTFDIYTKSPYAGQIIVVPPVEEVSDADAKPYDCHRNAVRHPRETKGTAFNKTELPLSDCCDSGGCC